jgi:F0F1-type ATP synthase membrane subunit b/b'
LANLERDLQEKQQLILNEAKKQIDLINDQAKQTISNLADQVGAIGQQETEHILQSTTTTTITSQAQATDTVVTVPITETVVTTPADNQLQVAIRR